MSRFLKAPILRLEVIFVSNEFQKPTPEFLMNFDPTCVFANGVLSLATLRVWWEWWSWFLEKKLANISGKSPWVYYKINITIAKLCMSGNLNSWCFLQKLMVEDRVGVLEIILRANFCFLNIVQIIVSAALPHAKLQ